MNQLKSLIRVQNVSHSYGRQLVLNTLHFQILAGEYTAIVGPNGGGKTTLMRLLVGTLPLQQGSIVIDGQSVQSSHAKQMLGYVPQRVLQQGFRYPTTVCEVLRSGRETGKHFFQWWDKKDQQHFEEAVELAGIADLLKKKVTELSGGQRQRVFIARALVMQPKILIMDEPFAGVDAASQKKFFQFLQQIRKEKHLTILLVSHDIEVMAHEVDRVLCLQQSLICHVPAAEFRKQEMDSMMHRVERECVHD